MHHHPAEPHPDQISRRILEQEIASCIKIVEMSNLSALIHIDAEIPGNELYFVSFIC